LFHTTPPLNKRREGFEPSNDRSAGDCLAGFGYLRKQ
jgi:hypothetical protein